MEKKHTAAKLHQDPLFLHDIFICAGFASISGNPETLHQKIQLHLVCIFFLFLFIYLVASQEELGFHW